MAPMALYRLVPLIHGWRRAVQDSATEQLAAALQTSAVRSPIQPIRRKQLLISLPRYQVVVPVQHFTVTVSLNPTAVITDMTNTVCSGATFTSSPTNGINGIVPAGTTYTWSVPGVTGAVTGGMSATGASFISGTLINPTNIAQTATYNVTPNTTACGNGAAFTVVVIVNPTPAITDMVATSCAGLLFAISPVNGINGLVPAGTKYSWPAPTGTGFTGGISRSLLMDVHWGLTNTTSSAATALFTVTPVAGSCSGAPFTVTVTINPKAIITAFTATTCSGIAFDATPADGTNGLVPSGTTYTWLLPTGTGFSGGASQTSATGNFTGTLVNTTNAAVTATYLVTPVVSGSGCAGSTFSVTVTVNPVVAVTDMSTTTCSGVTFAIPPVNGANGTVPAGTTYSWSAPTGAGITGGISAAGALDINGTLTNTTNTVQTATYLVTPSTINCGAGATFTVTVTVNPAATVNVFSATICSGTSFNFTPADVTDGTIPGGTTFKWASPIAPGINGGVAQTIATNHIFGTLVNTTNAAATATYTVIPTSGTCNGASFTVTVTVSPLASITVMTGTVFTGTPFTVTR